MFYSLIVKNNRLLDDSRLRNLLVVESVYACDFRRNYEMVGHVEDF